MELKLLIESTRGLGERKKRQMQEWTKRVKIRTRKKFLAVGKACMAILNILTYSRLKGSIFVNCQLWVLSHGDDNFCIHSTPLQVI